MKKDTIKEQAIAATAAELRVSEVTVRMIVSTYDATRAAYRRASSGATVKPKALGGGWYLLPNGERVQGKAKAAERMKELGSNG